MKRPNEKETPRVVNLQEPQESLDKTAAQPPAKWDGSSAGAKLQEENPTIPQAALSQVLMWLDAVDRNSLITFFRAQGYYQPQMAVDRWLAILKEIVAKAEDIHQSWCGKVYYVGEGKYYLKQDDGKFSPASEAQTREYLKALGISDRRGE